MMALLSVLGQVVVISMFTILCLMVYYPISIFIDLFYKEERT